MENRKKLRLAYFKCDRCSLTQSFVGHWFDYCTKTPHFHSLCPFALNACMSPGDELHAFHTLNSLSHFSE